MTRRPRSAAIVIARRLPARRSWTTTGATRSTFGRHGGFIIDLGRSDNEGTVFAVARNDDLAVFAALEHSFEIVEPEIPFGALLAVATET